MNMFFHYFYISKVHVYDNRLYLVVVILKSLNKISLKLQFDLKNRLEGETIYI